ncbi:MAG: sialidase family protein [Candidatus Latescibacterota bacterium]
METRPTPPGPPLPGPPGDPAPGLPPPAQPARGGEPPVAIPDLEAGTRFACLPDGSLLAVFARAVAGGGQEVVARTSTDDGVSWAPPRGLFSLGPPYAHWGFSELLADQNGELHAFFLIPGEKTLPAGGEAERPLVGELLDLRLDIGYARSRDGRTRWTAPRVLWVGYTGALNAVIQTHAGRILLPFSLLTSRTWARRGDGPAAHTFLGAFDSTVIYSDDGGLTWCAGPRLCTPVPDIVSAYGAVEPVVVERGDGSLWMLIRTQMGRFWESVSGEGATWSAPAPTAITSSDSPAGLVRLGDGRLVLFWNNCLRYPYAYGGRQVLHAAVSADQGRTWVGWREVGRDPRLSEPPPSGGDFGTAYPFPRRTGTDRVLFVSGQGPGRVLCRRLDPAWLSQTQQTADFALRAGEWSWFGTRGVEVVPHPQDPDGRALRVRRTDPEWPAAAVWNFPAGQAGTLRLRLLPGEGSPGACLLLTDHFSAPCDLEDELNAVYVLRAGPGPGSDQVVLPPGQWAEVEMCWNLETSSCMVSVDGRPAVRLPALRRSDHLCYLRLRPAGPGPDPVGYLVCAAQVEVVPPGSAPQSPSAGGERPGRQGVAPEENPHGPG